MEVDVPLLRAGYPTRATLPGSIFPDRLRLRGFHPLRPRTSTGVRLHGLGIIADSGTKPHISSELPRRIRFALCRFRSPLLPASHLISFPAGTEMFHFPAFPFRWKLPSTGTHRVYPVPDSDSGIPGSTAACAYPGLIAACHALPQRPSRAIHHGASVCSLDTTLPSLYRHHRDTLCHPSTTVQVVDFI